MRRLSIRFLAAILTFVVGVVFATIWYSTRQEPCLAHPSDHRLTASEAARVAECFVRDNGYTYLPPMADTSKLSSDRFVDRSSVEETLKMRHDSLIARAYGIHPGHWAAGDKTEDGWTVAFSYNLNHPYMRARYGQAFFDQLKGLGHIVIMDPYGGNLRFVHSPIRVADYPKIRRPWWW